MFFWVNVSNGFASNVLVEIEIIFQENSPCCLVLAKTPVQLLVYHIHHDQVIMSVSEPKHLHNNLFTASIIISPHPALLYHKSSIKFCRQIYILHRLHMSE